MRRTRPPQQEVKLSDMALAASLPRVTRNRSSPGGTVARRMLAAVPLVLAVVVALIYAAFVAHGLSDAVRGRICHTVTGIQHLPVQTHVDLAPAQKAAANAILFPDLPDFVGITAAPEHGARDFIAVHHARAVPIQALVIRWLDLLLWMAQATCVALIFWWLVVSARSATTLRCHRSVVLHC